MTSIYDDGARKARTEHMRLLGVSIRVPEDTLIQQRKAENEKYRPQAAFFVEWEPLSYRIEGGKYGNTTSQSLPFTFGLDPEDVEQIRQFGWRGAGNTGKRMSIPSSEGQAKDRWTKFMVRANKAGIDLGFDENGQLTSKDVGQVFEVEAGFVTFPTRIQDPKTNKWRDSDPEKGERAYSPFMILPVKKAPDYIQPEDVPVRVITSSDDDSESAPAATTTGTTASSGVSAEQLVAAFTEAGIIGSAADAYASASSQVNVTNKYGTRAPVLFAKEVQDAANAGGLIDYAIAKGAIQVLDGKIEAV